MHTKWQNIYNIFPIFAVISLLTAGIFLDGIYGEELYGKDTSDNIYARTNVREECRQILAGYYLNTYDQLEKSVQSIKRSEQRIADLKEEQLKTQKDLKRIAKALQEEPLHHENSREKLRLQAYQKQIDQLIADYSKSQKKLRKQHTTLQTREQMEKRQLEKVFIFKRMADKVDGGYPINIQYKSPCPKYRHVCALPKVDRENLKALELTNGLPEPCRRYISLSLAP